MVTRIVITGHVDHGKSTLIGRLLYDTGAVPDSTFAEVEALCAEMGKPLEFAYLLDSLEEERTQNVTIDLSEVHFRIDDRDYAIIDAPGHLEFLRNMITGASQADAAVLMVDASAGMEEQTRRHVQILGLMGVHELLVVLSKMDRVDYRQDRYEQLREEVSGFLDALGLRCRAYIPVSAAQGEHMVGPSARMPWYDGPALVQALKAVKQPATLAEQPFRFPVQDCYRVEGREVLVGRVESGSCAPGDRLVFLPSGQHATVRSIEAWPQARSRAEAGESIGITIDPPTAIRRGEVACREPLPTVRDRFEASILWFADEAGALAGDYWLRCATQEAACAIEQVLTRVDAATLARTAGGDALRSGEIAHVILHTAVPMVVEPFGALESLGRLVLRKGDETVAGAIITA